MNELLFTNVETGTLTADPSRGELVAVRGGGSPSGRYVGRTPAGTEWIAYGDTPESRDAKFTNMVSVFDKRYSDAVKLTGLTYAQWDWVEDYMSLMKEYEGTKVVASTKTTVTLREVDAKGLRDRLEALTEPELEDSVNMQYISPGSPQFDFAVRRLRSSVDALVRKLNTALEAS